MDKHNSLFFKVCLIFSAHEILLVKLMEKTTQVQIMAKILDCCKNPQTRMQVMHDVGLSLEILKIYLGFLGAQGLLEIHHSQEKYLITQKGLRFVKEWQDLAKPL